MKINETQETEIYCPIDRLRKSAEFTDCNKEVCPVENYCTNNNLTYCQTCLSSGECCLEMNEQLVKERQGASTTQVITSSQQGIDSLNSKSNDLLNNEPKDFLNNIPSEIKINLNKNSRISEEEILRNFFLPIDNAYHDKPLEIIFEMVEDENYIPKTDYEEKSFDSLRRKLHEVCGIIPSKEGSLADESLAGYFYDDVQSLNNEDLIYWQNTFSSLQMCPSFIKANTLINEIENCFIQTANLVESTFDSVRNNQLNSHQNNSITSNSYNHRREKLYTSSSTNKEGNDSINLQIDERNQSLADDAIYSPESIEYNRFLFNRPRHHNYDELQLNYNESHNDNYVSVPSNNGLINSNEENMMDSGFEQDVEDLFSQCYRFSSVEPSNSLKACLKNLESLCVQLKKAKHNILREMKHEYCKQSANYCDSSDSSDSGTFSLDSEECLSFINHLIETKLREKLCRRKIRVESPTLGLESETHEIIENSLEDKFKFDTLKYSFKENVNHSDKFKNDLNIINNAPKIAFNHSSTKMNKDMHTTPTDSKSHEITSSNIFLNNQSKIEYQDQKKHNNHLLSYEETLALYEDNQELQKSLLSILHSLNDIHDNFLLRRKREVALSRNISLNNFNKHLLEREQEIIKENHHSSRKQIFLESRNSDQNCNGDSESIKKINQISDELRNLWLYCTKDLQVRTRQTRSVSLNRNIEDTKDQRLSYNENEIQLLEPCFPNMDSFTKKSLSLPNLTIGKRLFNQPDRQINNHSPDSIPEEQHKEERVKDFEEWNSREKLIEAFAKRINEENEKNHEFTLSFLQRIMETCNNIESFGEEWCNYVLPSESFSCNDAMRTC